MFLFSSTTVTGIYKVIREPARDKTDAISGVRRNARTTHESATTNASIRSALKNTTKRKQQESRPRSWGHDRNTRKVRSGAVMQSLFTLVNTMDEYGANKGERYRGA